MSEKEIKQAEFESLRSEWLEALLAADEALHAEEGVLPDEELEARERRLREECKAVAADLRQLARDEWIAPELAEPFRLGRRPTMRRRTSRAGRGRLRSPGRCRASR